MAEPILLPELVVRPDDPGWIPTGTTPGGGDQAATGTAPATPAPAPFPDSWIPGQPIGQPAEPPSLPSDDNILKRALRSVQNAWTGEDRIPDAYRDVPEFFDSDIFTPAQKAKLAFVASMTGDAQALQNAAVSMLGKAAKPARDQQGNLLIRMGDKLAYLDKPGASKANLFDAAGYAPNLMVPPGIGTAARFAGRGVLNTAIRSAAQGAGQGAVESGKQLGGIALGSGRFDYRRPLDAAIGGAAAEPALAGSAALLRGIGTQATRFPAAQPLLTPEALQLSADAPLQWQHLNATGQRIFGQTPGLTAGRIPDDFTVGTMQRLADIAPTIGTRGMLNDPETLRRAMQSARLNIPYTVGQLTGSKAELAREDWLRNQKTMPGAADIMEGFGGVRAPDAPQLSTQQRAIRDKAAELPGAPPPGNRPPGELPPGQNEIGAQLYDRLTRTREGLYDAQRGAYEQLGATTGRQTRELPTADQLNFHVSASQDFLDELRRIDQVVQGNNPNLAVGLIARTIGQPGQANPVRRHIVGGEGGAATPPRLRNLNVGDYNDLRKQLGLLAAGSDNSAQRNLIRDYIGALDRSIERAEQSGRMTGPAEGLTNLREAMRLHREYRNFIEPKDEAARSFMESLTRPDLTGRQVAEGLLDTTGTPQILGHIDRMYGRGSEARALIRQALHDRAVFGGRSRPEDFQPGHVARRLTDALDGKDAEVYRRFFNAGELDELRTFRDGMRRMQETVKQNLSGTAYTLPQAQAQNMTNYIRGLIKPGGLLSRTFGAEQRAMSDARRATGGRLPDRELRDIDQPIGTLRRQVLPAAGGVAGAENQLPAPAAATGAGLLHFFNWDSGNGASR